MTVTSMAGTLREQVLPPLGRLLPERGWSGGPLTATFVSAPNLLPLRAEWRSLEARACEPNVFYGSDFAMSSAFHVRDGRQPLFLFIQDMSRPPGMQMVGMLPLQTTRGSDSSASLGSWGTAFMVLGTPLLDRSSPDQVFLAMLRALERRSSASAVLALRSIDAEGVFARTVQTVAARSGRHLVPANAASRALLLPTESARRAGVSETARKRTKELNRLRRRLGEIGTLTFGYADSYDSIRPALERFLHLEVGGWKGQRGTALLQDPSLAAFCRTAVWALAARGEARIGELLLDGRPIASAIALIADGTGFLWKIAYDEAFAKHGPGVLLIQDIGRALLGDGLFAVDSCALPGNTMIERLWTGRRQLADFYIGLGQAGAERVEQAATVDARTRAWRERAKAAYHQLRGLLH